MQHDHIFSFSHHARPGALRFFSAVTLLALTMFGAIGACTPEETPAQCVGGIIMADGVCEGTCDPAKCLAGNTCVGNRCVLECDAHNDCLEDGTQNCAPAVEDGPDMRAIMACQPNGVSSGVGTKCPFGDECGGLFSCETTGERCNPNQCGGAADACKLNQEACYAKANCNIGTCPDGSACTVFSCTPQECTAELTCVSSGEGDADAYCTSNDCQVDADCPGTFYCGVTRDPHELCGSSPKKGNNKFCGLVPLNTPCTQASALGQGNTVFEGQLCLLRNSCVMRKDCAPCNTDMDCGEIANHCISMPGETQKRCARECLSSTQCGDEFACTALDVDPTKKVCTHRFGACTGAGKFCEPCLNDAECGPITGTSACYEFSGGQRGCFTACNSNADCPPSPSGNLGACLLDNPASLFYKHCVPDGNNRCW